MTTLSRRILVIVCAVLVGGNASRAAWSWKLDAQRYGQMNLFERAQYDKASRLFEANDYRAAAAEFEKFKVQFPDSAMLSYVLFMRGYSLQGALDRNAAIKVYNEVLDYFGDAVDDAAPALFYLGVAELDNGDLREGLEAMLEVVEDEDYQKHPVAAGALRRLADNKWRNGEHEAAVTFWKQSCRDFSDANPVEANAARDNVTDYYIKSRNYSGLENWLLNDETRNKPETRKWVADYAWGRAWGNFQTGWDKYTNFNKAEKTADINAFYAWFKRQKPWYDKAEDGWRYYHNAVYFASQRLWDKPETKRLIDESMPLHQAIKDEKERNGRFAWLSDRMREARDWQSCVYCIGKMTDAAYAGYKRYEMYYTQNDWKQAIKQLEQLEASKNAYWSERALAEHGRLFKDVLARYEEAIKIFQRIANPPTTLWHIQDAYYRWGKLDNAITTLTEIENSFPDQSARAAWQKASYYHTAGQAKQAVSAARRVLKLYPKSAESSKAHQLLEGYGIATGGGLLDEE